MGMKLYHILEIALIQEAREKQFVELSQACS